MGEAGGTAGSTGGSTEGGVICTIILCSGSQQGTSAQGRWKRLANRCRQPRPCWPQSPQSSQTAGRQASLLVAQGSQQESWPHRLKRARNRQSSRANRPGRSVHALQSSVWAQSCVPQNQCPTVALGCSSQQRFELWTTAGGVPRGAADAPVAEAGAPHARHVAVNNHIEPFMFAPLRPN